MEGLFGGRARFRNSTEEQGAVGLRRFMEHTFPETRGVPLSHASGSEPMLCGPPGTPRCSRTGKTRRCSTRRSHPTSRRCQSATCGSTS